MLIGIDNAELIRLVITQLRSFGSGTSTARLNAGLALVAAFQPRTEAEALLCTQLAMAHTLAVSMAAQVAGATRPENQAMALSLANKLMKTFVAQMEALGRMRGQACNASVNIGQVQVQPGAQAVVGVVNRGSDGTQNRKSA